MACKRQLVVSDVSNSSNSHPTCQISKASLSFPLCPYQCLCDVAYVCAQYGVYLRAERVCRHWYYFSSGYEQLLLATTHTHTHTHTYTHTHIHTCAEMSNKNKAVQVVKTCRQDRMAHPQQWLSIGILRREETPRIGHDTITITNCISILRPECSRIGC